jgi:hypothetical protein
MPSTQTATAAEKLQPRSLANFLVATFTGFSRARKVRKQASGLRAIELWRFSRGAEHVGALASSMLLIWAHGFRQAH